MPPTRRAKPEQAADALAGVAPLTTRWMERLLAAHEPPLTMAQYLALRAIDSEPVGVAELARRTGVSGPAVSQLVAALAAQGSIERTPTTNDRRRHELALSAAGERTLRSAAKLVRERLVELLAELPKPEADALGRGLPQVEAMLAGSAPPRRPKPRRPQPPPRPRKPPRPR